MFLLCFRKWMLSQIPLRAKHLFHDIVTRRLKPLVCKTAHIFGILKITCFSTILEINTLYLIVYKAFVSYYCDARTLYSPWVCKTTTNFWAFVKWNIIFSGIPDTILLFTPLYPKNLFHIIVTRGLTALESARRHISFGHL